METLVIRRRWRERTDVFMGRVMLWMALGDRVEWLPSLLPWRATTAARITRADRAPDFSIDPAISSEPLRNLVRQFVRDELRQADRPFHQANQ